MFSKLLLSTLVFLNCHGQPTELFGVTPHALMTICGNSVGCSRLAFTIPRKYPICVVTVSNRTYEVITEE